MDQTSSFGYWLRRRRKALDLTQEQLAQRVGCATETIKKIETDVRRPSRQLAERLAVCLVLPAEERATFLAAARAELATDHLAVATAPLDTAAGVPSASPQAAATLLPSGTVTFLFTDIEGSTKRWEQQPQAMRAALARHDTLVRTMIETHGGHVFKTVGDAFCAAFANTHDALLATLDAQRALQSEDWGEIGPLRVRMALHTGAVIASEGDYLGPALNRVARLLSAGHGGQILLSHVTAELLREQLPPDVELRDLGQHRLKDLARPEQIAQIVTPDQPADFPSLRTLEARPHNLPTQPTALIGREHEIAQACALLRRADVRLATLTGPGGTGKTRLSLQVAAELLDSDSPPLLPQRERGLGGEGHFPDGAYFVNLAPISDPALVVATIAQTLGVKESASRPLLESLKDELREKQLLLLLDNFEQVLVAAPQIAELLASCPKLKVLITSREVLHLYGEHEFGVPPLKLPDRAQLPPLERLTQYEAVRLFIERAQAVKPDFAVTNENAPSVAEICYRLDGLPLAIELAAARIKLFPPQALLTKLDSPLKFLTGGARDLPQRQQTIRATIDWSYELLDEAEKTLFARLGVFVGGCTLEAAEAVCEDKETSRQGEKETDQAKYTVSRSPGLPVSVSVLDELAALVDKSLLRQEEGVDGEPRFVMLETIREYALERLAAHGEAEALRDRHLAYYLALAETAAPHFRGAEQIVWAERLEVEHDNFRAALAWAHERGAVESATAESAEVELRLAGALFWFWDIRDYQSEGRHWLEGALTPTNRPARTPARATALRAAGDLAFKQVFVAARSRLEESVAIWRELGDKCGLALALDSLGWVTLYERRVAAARALFAEGVALWRELGDKCGLAWALRGLGGAVRRDDPAAARPILEESVALFREVGDRSGLAVALMQLGTIAQLDRDQTRAAAVYEESLAVSRELGNKVNISALLINLGYVAQAQGDYARAMALYREALVLVRPSMYMEWIAEALMGVAGVAGAVRQAERAARLLSAAETLLTTAGLSVSAWPELRADYERYLAAARAQLDEATFAAAWEAGRAMSLDQAIAEALDIRA